MSDALILTIDKIAGMVLLVAVAGIAVVFLTANIPDWIAYMRGVRQAWRFFRDKFRFENPKFFNAERALDHWSEKGKFYAYQPALEEKLRAVLTAVDGQDAHAWREASELIAKIDEERKGTKK